MFRLIFIFIILIPKVLFSAVVDSSTELEAHRKQEILTHLSGCFNPHHLKKGDCPELAPDQLTDVARLQRSLLTQSIRDFIWPKLIQRYLQLRILAKRLGLPEVIPSASFSEGALPPAIYPQIFKEIFPFESTVLGTAFGKDSKKGKIFDHEKRAYWQAQITELNAKYHHFFLPDALKEYLKPESMLIEGIGRDQENPMQAVADRINPFINKLNTQFIRAASSQYIQEELGLSLTQEMRKAYKKKLTQSFEEFIMEHSSTPVGQMMLTAPLLSYLAAVREKIDHIDSVGKRVKQFFSVSPEHYSHKFLERIDRPGNIAYSRDHIGYRASAVVNPSSAAFDPRGYSSSLRSAGKSGLKDLQKDEKGRTVVPIKDLPGDPDVTKNVMIGYLREQIKFIQGLAAKIMDPDSQLSDFADEIYPIAPELITNISKGSDSTQHVLTSIVCNAIKKSVKHAERREKILKGIGTFLPVISLPVAITAVGIGIAGLAGAKVPAMLPVGFAISEVMLKGIESAHQHVEYVHMRGLQRKVLGQALMGGRARDVSAVTEAELPHPQVVWSKFMLFAAFKSSLLIAGSITEAQIEQAKEYEEKLHELEEKLTEAHQAAPEILHEIERVKSLLESTETAQESTSLPSETSNFLSVIASSQIAVSAKISKIKDFLSKRIAVDHDEYEEMARDVMRESNPHFSEFVERDQCLSFAQFYPLWDRLKRRPCSSPSQDLLLARLDVFSKKYKDRICFTQPGLAPEAYQKEKLQVIELSIKALCPAKAAELLPHLPNIEDLKSSTASDESRVKERVDNLLLILNSPPPPAR